MMNNIIFAKFIFLIIIVTNATAYDTCLSPRTKDQDCDCDIRRPLLQNIRNNGYLIEFAVCRDYKDEGGDIMPLAVLVTPYDPVNTLPVYSKGKKIGESHWFNVIHQQSWRTNWKPWSWSTGGTRWYCPDITIAGVEGGDQGNAEYKGHWKKKYGDDVQTATDLVCPKSQASTTVTYSTYDRNKDAAQQNYIGIRQTFCPTSTWYQYSFLWHSPMFSSSSTHIPSFIRCPQIAAPCDGNDDDCACYYFGDDEVCKNYVPPTKAPKEAPTTDAPRKIEEPQTVEEKKDNDRFSLPWESTFGWIIFAVTMVAAAGMFYTLYSNRNANNDYSDAIRSGEGAEMGYLPMMEKQ